MGVLRGVVGPWLHDEDEGVVALVAGVEALAREALAVLHIPAHTTEERDMILSLP